MKHLYSVILLVFLSVPQIVQAHEPLFGLGPHTMYKYGIALETEFERFDSVWFNQTEILYGLTADWAVTAAVVNPLQGQNSFSSLSLRTKYRFYRKDRRGASNQAAIHAGVFFPNTDKFTTDYFIGLSYGYESRRHYFFSGLRYRINGTLPNVSRADLAYGIRPWLLEYMQPDPVFLLELNGWLRGNADALPSVTTFLLSLSPGLLFSYRNVMFKAGIRLPFLYESKRKPPYELILGLEYHFPPIY